MAAHRYFLFLAVTLLNPRNPTSLRAGVQVTVDIVLQYRRHGGQHLLTVNA
jgi:hypothetical protein